MPSTHLRAVLAVMVLAGVATGCSSGQDSSGRTSPPTAAEPEQSLHPVGAEWRYRFDWASPQDYYGSSYALWQDATQACMSAAGFEYEPVVYVDTDAVYALVNPLNEAVAEQYGYSPPEVQAAPDSNVGNDAFYAALLDPDGCSNVALSYAYGGPAADTFTERFQALVGDAEGSIFGFEATAAGEQLLLAWSQCMSSTGFDYRTPHEAMVDVSKAEDAAELGRRVRLADLECDRQVGLTAGRSAFEQESTDDWADRNAPQIGELVAALDAAQLEVADRQQTLADRGPLALEGVEPYRDSGEMARTSDG